MSGHSLVQYLSKLSYADKNTTITLPSDLPLTEIVHSTPKTNYRGRDEGQGGKGQDGVVEENGKKNCNPF